MNDVISIDDSDDVDYGTLCFNQKTISIEESFKRHPEKYVYPSKKSILSSQFLVIPGYPTIKTLGDNHNASLDKPFFRLYESVMEKSSCSIYHTNQDVKFNQGDVGYILFIYDVCPRKDTEDTLRVLCCGADSESKTMEPKLFSFQLDQIVSMVSDVKYNGKLYPSVIENRTNPSILAFLHECHTRMPLLQSTPGCQYSRP